MAMVKRTNQMLNGETPIEANMRKIHYEQEKTLRSSSRPRFVSTLESTMRRGSQVGRPVFRIRIRMCLGLLDPHPDP